MRRLAIAALALLVLGCGSSAVEPTTTSAQQTISLATAPVGNACDQALASGTLARDERTGLGISDPAGLVHGVVWPAGWYAQVVSGEAQLLDIQGAVVAVEGDRIQFGGGLGADDLFHVCPAQVERL